MHIEPWIYPLVMAFFVLFIIFSLLIRKNLKNKHLNNSFRILTEAYSQKKIYSDNAMLTPPPIPPSKPLTLENLREIRWPSKGVLFLTWDQVIDQISREEEVSSPYKTSESFRKSPLTWDQVIDQISREEEVSSPYKTRESFRKSPDLEEIQRNVAGEWARQEYQQRRADPSHRTMLNHVNENVLIGVMEGVFSEMKRDSRKRR